MRISDWSSDVCSSDLISADAVQEQERRTRRPGPPARDAQAEARHMLGSDKGLPGDPAHRARLATARRYAKPRVGAMSRAGTAPPPREPPFRGAGSRRSWPPPETPTRCRSEAHTSELQSLK